MKVTEKTINEQITSENNIFYISVKNFPNELHLCETEWSVFSEINGKNTIIDLAHILGFKVNTVKLAVYNLLTRNLIKKIVGS